MNAARVRAFGTAGALAVAVAIGYAAQSPGAVAAPTPNCPVHASHPAPVAPTPLARGHLIPV